MEGQDLGDMHQKGPCHKEQQQKKKKNTLLKGWENDVMSIVGGYGLKHRERNQFLKFLCQDTSGSSLNII